MNNQQKTDDTLNNESKEPDDETGVYVESHIKIFDPSTEEVFVAQRS